MIDSGLLTHLRALEERAMPNTATIRRSPLATDSMGRTTQSTWPTDWTVVEITKCRITEIGFGEERIIAEQLQVREPYTLRLLHGTDLTESDRIVVGSRTFEVRSVIEKSYPTKVKAVCSEIHP